MPLVRPLCFAGVAELSTVPALLLLPLKYMYTYGAHVHNNMDLGDCDSC